MPKQFKLHESAGPPPAQDPTLRTDPDILATLGRKVTVYPMVGVRGVALRIEFDSGFRLQGRRVTASNTPALARHLAAEGLRPVSASYWRAHDKQIDEVGGGLRAVAVCD